jgi:CRP/FNR family transcriptional regulator, transcriptional activator FtrB
MTPADIELATRLPLIAGLEEQQRQRLLGSATLERHPIGTVLFHEGEPARRLHFLLSGTVELFTSHTARDCGLLLLTPGDMFMPAAVLFEEEYLNSARVLVPSRLLMLDAATVREEVGRSPALGLEISKSIAGQFRMAVRHIIDLKCRSAGQRLAAFLLRLVDESKTADSAELPVPKRHLASRVGMTAETLSRAIQTLADNGLVVRGNRVFLRDRARIEQYCGPALYADADEAALEVHAL